jgi:hypothetical protein
MRGGWDNFKLQYYSLTRIFHDQGRELGDLRKQNVDPEATSRIDLTQLLDGGPPKDGIPSIDQPIFDTAATTPFQDDDLVVGMVINGEAKAYPFNVLNWHGIVNDTVGGGFTGLFAAMHLCHQQHPHPILLIDKSDRFVFKPLLYELLSGELTEQQAWPKYDDLLNCDEITFIHDAVHRIDLDRQEVMLASGQRHRYGHLVLGLGSIVHDFGIPGVKDHAFAFRTGEDVDKLRRHLRQCLQQASQTSDTERRRALLTVTIIGAGPAGVKMAATLGDLLPQWASTFEGLVAELTVAIVNRSPEILKGDINDGLRNTVQQSLQKRLLPVQFITGSASPVEPDLLTYEHNDQDHTLPTHTIIWTTGNRVNPVIADLPLPDEHKDKPVACGCCRPCRCQATPLSLPGATARC